MKSDEIKKRLEELEEEKKLYLMERDFRSTKSNDNRARSVTVGTAFGGSTEVSMRGDAGGSLWALLQPVEVIELIHQLAASAGCHIAIKPRDDFSSWREWRKEDQSKLLSGQADFQDNLSTYYILGAKGNTSQVEEQVTENKFIKKDDNTLNEARKIKPRLIKKDLSDDNVVATKGFNNRRKSKRPTTSP